jgi:hypothetical protein
MAAVLAAGFPTYYPQGLLAPELLHNPVEWNSLIHCNTARLSSRE